MTDSAFCVNCSFNPSLVPAVIFTGETADVQLLTLVKRPAEKIPITRHAQLTQKPSGTGRSSLMTISRSLSARADNCHASVSG